MPVVPLFEDPDLQLRQAAVAKARELQQLFEDLVPLRVLAEGFSFEGQRISFGSFKKGIHRAKEQSGPAALSLMTTAPKPGVPPPYEDHIDEGSGVIEYRYRSGSPDQFDNRVLRAALELQAPLIYFRGIVPGQYQVIAPVFVTADNPGSSSVSLQIGLPTADMQGEGLVSSEDTRRYALTLVAARTHQRRFREEVLAAYGRRCAICALREVDLLEASHIIRDGAPEGIAAVVNGLALCAIHHRAYDRNLLGIDPRGIVHMNPRLMREIDGPMLGNGLQHFDGVAMHQPRREIDRPDPERLAVRFEEFERVAA